MMILNKNYGYRKIIIEVVCLLYILLFVYAAVSKLLDFENFQAQIGQSPLLTAYVRVISYSVIVIEIVLSILLIFPRFKLIALYSAFSLMTMFTVYIFIILNYTSNIPCSCGGILEKMGWKEHLIFNCVFTLMAAGSILLFPSNTKVIPPKL
jgi:uncharacterized membrane protein YphA (DoxX/SURF4 family)